MHLGTNSPHFFFFLLIFFTLLINWLHWASLWSVIATSSSSAGAKEAGVAFIMFPHGRIEFLKRGNRLIPWRNLDFWHRIFGSIFREESGIHDGLSDPSFLPPEEC